MIFVVPQLVWVSWPCVWEALRELFEGSKRQCKTLIFSDFNTVIDTCRLECLKLIKKCEFLWGFQATRPIENDPVYTSGTLELAYVALVAPPPKLGLLISTSL